MHDSGSLLDAFAEVRRTWDDLVNVQPDIVAGSVPLSDADLSVLSERIGAHVVAAVALEDAVEILRAEKGGA